MITGYIIRLKGMAEKEHSLLEIVDQGVHVEKRGWTVYSTRKDAEEMKEFGENVKNPEDVIEIVEVTINGLA